MPFFDIVFLANCKLLILCTVLFKFLTSNKMFSKANILTVDPKMLLVVLETQNDRIKTDIDELTVKLTNTDVKKWVLTI